MEDCTAYSTSKDDGQGDDKIHSNLARLNKWRTPILVGGILFALVAVNLRRFYPSTAHTSVRSEHERRVILVTGAAGFVGFSVACKLSEDPNNVIVGLDNFNDYYDVQLKIDRAYELHLRGVTIHNADLCHEEFLVELFALMNFTHVVHLGAQAGVRYSLDHPLTYIKSNIEGHQAVLNVVKKYKDVRFVYASSSSVYGKTSPVPFRLSANVDNPGNMYAATKRANELMSYQHCVATGIRNVGFRFFTVYGPWGRPDMAVYGFAERIMNGQKVPLFNVSALGRDFTYIDDIVTGVVNSLDYEPSSCGVVFNFGFGNPVSVHRLINILEQEIGEKAQIDLLPLPPTEIVQTWADTHISKQELNFYPQTDLVQGVKKFVAWFKLYRDQRDDQTRGFGKSVKAKRWFDKLPSRQKSNVVAFQS